MNHITGTLWSTRVIASVVVVVYLCVNTHTHTHIQHAEVNTQAQMTFH